MLKKRTAQEALRTKAVAARKTEKAAAKTKRCVQRECYEGATTLNHL